MMVDPAKMSMEMASERVCYVQCNFCTTILAVSVPSSIMFTIVTVRCGHCATLLSVNMGALFHQSHHHHIQDFQKQFFNEAHHHHALKDNVGTNSSSSKWNRFGSFPAAAHEQPNMTAPIRPPEKRQRVPSAYNRFIKEEIQRIKTSNPEISHREAFSAAAKNWAHFPHIHFGLKLDSTNQTKIDHTHTGEGTPKSLGLY